MIESSIRCFNCLKITSVSKAVQEQSLCRNSKSTGLRSVSLNFNCVTTFISVQISLGNV